MVGDSEGDRSVPRQVGCPMIWAGMEPTGGRSRPRRDRAAAPARTCSISTAESVVDGATRSGAAALAASTGAVDSGAAALRRPPSVSASRPPRLSSLGLGGLEPRSSVRVVRRLGGLGATSAASTAVVDLGVHDGAAATPPTSASTTRLAPRPRARAARPSAAASAFGCRAPSRTSRPCRAGLAALTGTCAPGAATAALLGRRGDLGRIEPEELDDLRQTITDTIDRVEQRRGGLLGTTGRDDLAAHRARTRAHRSRRPTGPG